MTEWTVFRHFPDKREVLFDGEAKLREALTGAIEALPARHRPLDALLAAFQAIAPRIEANRPFAEPRQHVIATTPALQTILRGAPRSLRNVAANARATVLLTYSVGLHRSRSRFRHSDSVVRTSVLDPLQTSSTSAVGQFD